MYFRPKQEPPDTLAPEPVPDRPIHNILYMSLRYQTILCAYGPNINYINKTCILLASLYQFGSYWCLNLNVSLQINMKLIVCHYFNRFSVSPHGNFSSRREAESMLNIVFLNRSSKTRRTMCVCC